MSIEGDLVGATSTQTASTPVGSTLRHWPLTLLLAVSGLVAGLLIGNSAPVTYRSEARLAVGPGSNSAYVIAGYPLAARDLAANYSRWVQNNARSGVWAVPGLTALSASPIPDSAVIRVEAEAEDPQLATKGAHLVAKRLVTVVGEQQRKNDPQRAFAQFQKLAPAVANAQAQLDSARTSKQKHEARVRLATAQLARDAQGDLYRRLSSDPQAVSQLVVIAPAAAVGNDRRAGLLRWALVGLGAGLVLALLVASARDALAAIRRRVRGRRVGTAQAVTEAAQPPAAEPSTGTAQPSGQASRSEVSVTPVATAGSTPGANSASGPAGHRQRHDEASSTGRGAVTRAR